MAEIIIAERSAIKLIVASSTHRKSEDQSLKKIVHYIAQINPIDLENYGISLYTPAILKNQSKKVAALIIANSQIKPGQIYIPINLRKKLNTPPRTIVNLDLTYDIATAKSVTMRYSKIENSETSIARGVLVLGSLGGSQTHIATIKLPNYFVGRPIYPGFTIDIAGYKLTVEKINDGADLNTIFRATSKTTYKLLDSKKYIGDVSWAQIGGLEAAKKQISEVITYLSNSKLQKIINKLGISLPRGIILHGPPGTGKTLLLRGLAHIPNIHFQMIASPELSSIYHGQAEQKIRKIFETAQKNAPSIIVIDELSAIAGKLENQRQDKKIISQLLACMDGLKKLKNVLVIAATKDVSLLPAGMRRNGRFDCEIEIGIPNEIDRLKILKILTAKMGIANSVLIEVAGNTHGFVGADLQALVNSAGLNAINRQFLKAPTENVVIDISDFKTALKTLEPSALRYYSTKRPDTKWSQIGGLKPQINKILDQLLIPLKHKKTFKLLNCKPLRGAILHGPPGTGKTLIAKAIANELSYNFISIKGPELLNKYVGETEAEVRRLFKLARYLAPCIIFVDEIDALSTTRGQESTTGVQTRITGQILTELDGLNDLNDVLVLATTNRLDALDPALLRAGRLELKVKIDRPTKKGIQQIMKIHFKKFNIKGSIKSIVSTAYINNLVGADIAAVSRRVLIKMLKQGAGVEKMASEISISATKILDQLKIYISEMSSKLGPLSH